MRISKFFSLYKTLTVGLIFVGLFYLVAVFKPAAAIHEGVNEPSGFDSPPTILSLTKTSCNSIRVSWNPAQPTSEIAEVSVSWRFNDGSGLWQNTVVLPAGTTSYDATAHDLRPGGDPTMNTGTQYFFMIGNKNISGTGGYYHNGYVWSDIRELTAGCPPATPTPTSTPTPTPTATPTTTPPPTSGDFTVSAYCAVGSNSPRVRMTWNVTGGSSLFSYDTTTGGMNADQLFSTAGSGTIDPWKNGSWVNSRTYDLKLYDQFSNLLRQRSLTTPNCLPSLPELVVESINISPVTPVSNQPAVATVRVRNNGVANAGSARVRFWSHQSVAPGFATAAEAGVSDQSVTLAQGASQDLNFTFTKTAGSYTAYAVIDNGDPGAVDESNDTISNNRNSRAYTVINLPNLIISNISLSPANPNAGQTVTATVTVRNIGLASAGAARVRFWSSRLTAPVFSTAAESGIADKNTPVLAANATTDLTFTFSKVAGNYTAFALVDNGDPGAVDETDDSVFDNVGSLAYVVGTGKDYTISWTNPSDQSINAGDNATYSFRIEPLCSPSWAGTLAVTVNYTAVSPADGKITGLPGSTSQNISCSPFANRDLSFTLNSDPTAPKGQVYTFGVVTSATGLSDKSLSGTLRINQGNFLQTQGGDVWSAGQLALSTPPAAGQYTSQYLLQSKEALNANATSGRGWKVGSYGNLNVSTSYNELKNLAGGAGIKPLTESSCNFNNATKPTVEGVRICNSINIAEKKSWLADLKDSFVRIINGSFWAAPVEADTSGLSQTVIFVEGDMTINTNLTYSGNQVALFIVKGRINIANSVTTVNAYLFADRGITTSYDNQNPTNSLVIRGGVAIGANAGVSDINFNRRSLTPATEPAERIVYDPRILVAFADIQDNLLGVPGITYTEVQP